MIDNGEDLGHRIIQLLIECDPSYDDVCMVQRIVNEFCNVMRGQLEVIEGFEQFKMG